MEYLKITAIIRGSTLEEVERGLHKIGVNGVSVSHVKGYGECANFFRRDWMVTHARIEIFCAASRAEEIIQAIMEAAHSGLAGDGIVAIIPVNGFALLAVTPESARAVKDVTQFKIDYTFWMNLAALGFSVPERRPKSMRGPRRRAFRRY